MVTKSKRKKSLRVSEEQMRLIHERDNILIQRWKTNELAKLVPLNERLMEINRELGV